MNARLVLEREGWEVDEAADCASAIASLEAGDYDLVVCDVMLPDGNGLDVVRRTTEISPETAVLVMTASETGLTFEAVAAAGATALLQKPFSLGALLDEVRRRTTDAVPAGHARDARTDPAS
jgi:DNA-binding response OmpR family regulator